MPLSAFFYLNQMFCFCWNWCRHPFKVAPLWKLFIFLPKVILVGHAGKSFAGNPSLWKNSCSFLVAEQVLIPQGQYTVMAKPAQKQVQKLREATEKDCTGLRTEMILGFSSVWFCLEMTHDLVAVCRETPPLVKNIFLSLGLITSACGASLVFWHFSFKSGASDWHPVQPVLSKRL